MKDSAKHRYAAALGLYASSDRTIKSICEELGLSFKALTSYISKNHRNLILRRHKLEGFDGDVRLRGTKGQTTAAHLKYREAVEAAGSLEYIEFNMSQIARIFGVDPTGLANQLRRHYPEIIPNREKERRRLGVNDNIHHGVRPWCSEDYAPAVELLRNSDMTVAEAAEACGVAYRGLKSHLHFYQKDLVGEREAKRQAAAGRKVRGERTGTWTIHEPEEETTGKYAEALELYRTSSLSVKEIAERFGLGLGAFKYHLRQWNSDLMVERRGYGRGTDYSKTKRYRKDTVAKYAPAIEKLRSGGKSVRAVALEFGLNPEVFRLYLKEHEPELIARAGMTKLANGRRVGIKSSAKNAEAVRLYATTDEPLKSIAARLGLVYVSLGNYLRRNHPDLLRSSRNRNLL